MRSLIERIGTYRTEHIRIPCFRVQQARLLGFLDDQGSGDHGTSEGSTEDGGEDDDGVSTSVGRAWWWNVTTSCEQFGVIVGFTRASSVKAVIVLGTDLEKGG